MKPVRLAAMLLSAALGAASLSARAETGWPWKLTGTLLNADRKVAIFADANGNARSIAEGKEIDGWTVAAIHAHSATLTGQGTSRSIAVDGFAPEQDSASTETGPMPQQKDAAVRETLARQERDNKTALESLSAATKQMELQKTPK